MTTLEIPLDDDLQAFVQRESQARGHASAAAYIESLLFIERLKGRPQDVAASLKDATGGESQIVDDGYWQRLEAETFGKNPADTTP